MRRTARNAGNALRNIRLTCTIFLASLATAQEASPLLFGPLRFGMSVEQAKEEIPDAGWQDFRKSKYSGQTTAIRAQKTFEIAGMPFLAEIHAAPLDTYKLRYVRVWKVDDFRQCHDAALALIAAFEPAFGAFEGHQVARNAAVGASASTTRTPGGAIVVSPQLGGIRATGFDTVRAGNHSSITVETTGYAQRPSTSAEIREGRVSRYRADSHRRFEHSPGPIDLDLRASFDRDGNDCGLEMVASREPPTRAPERYSFVESKIVRQFSISARNRDLRRLETLPAGGMSFVFNCKVARATGNVDFCKLADPTQDTADRRYLAALWQVMAIDLDVSDLNPDDPLPLEVTIPISLDRANLRQPQLGGSCSLDIATLGGNPRISRRPVTSPSPDGEKRSRKPSEIAGTVEVACEVQADASLICMPAPGHPVTHPALVEPALTAAELGWDQLKIAKERAPAACVVRQTLAFETPVN